ncbi:type I-E CRISPR-associated protein Cas7/Cse4/CasC [Aeromonas enteropelogenes]|uniref:type I-E CRISPR-associated protein Cas7/Cse4/CasC n=1 Tax=Aeromonas enteropelogenes TaxID=29489 RepID=UPI003B9F7891
MHNDLKSTRIEFHILQSFPVTCLNRDDIGAPKTATVGGVTRARVSSQCWKRQVRLGLQTFGIRLGVRTKRVNELIKTHCLKLGATNDQAQACSQRIADELVDDTLIFISDSEALALACYAEALAFDVGKIKRKDLATLARKSFNPAHDALDIALFGRMVAKATDMNIEAAASFSHAISTHKVANEVEFFTALDDWQDAPKSAHIGNLEFNSATYYRYISLDLGQLAHSLGEEAVRTGSLKQAIEAFTKALFIAQPTARQATQSGASPWEFAKVLVRKGQRLQVPFDEPVRAATQGYLLPSVAALKHYLNKKEKLSGTLFGKLGDYEWGEDEQFSLDHLIAKLQGHVE